MLGVGAARKTSWKKGRVRGDPKGTGDNNGLVIAIANTSAPESILGPFCV